MSLPHFVARQQLDRQFLIKFVSEPTIQNGLRVDKVVPGVPPICFALNRLFSFLYFACSFSACRLVEFLFNFGSFPHFVGWIVPAFRSSFPAYCFHIRQLVSRMWQLVSHIPHSPCSPCLPCSLCLLAGVSLFTAFPRSICTFPLSIRAFCSPAQPGPRLVRFGQ